MSEPFVGEIRMFAGNFAPRGWAFCDGQLLAISQNDALFSLLGTIYGGDGYTTFGLPDHRGRLALNMGQSSGLSDRRQGIAIGAEDVTLTTNQIPSHTHPLQAQSEEGEYTLPLENKIAPNLKLMHFSEVNPDNDMKSDLITTTGGSRSHTNLMPFLCINYIIALFGIYPSRI